MLPVRPPETHHMPLADGVTLATDIYRPAGPGDFPVLLMRQPYGRAIASTVCYAHPAWYAAQGYIVAVQDVRGRGGSGGTFTLFAQERDDGAAAIVWAANLPGSTGAVGMYGFSYQGDAQLLAAARQPPALKAIAPAMIGWDMRRFWAYENGAFCLAANLTWAIQLGAEEAKRAGDVAAFQALYAAARAPPYHSRIAAEPPLLELLDRYAPHYLAWRTQAQDSPYWRTISPAADAGSLLKGAPPALFIGGWFDTHLPGTVAAYRAFENSGRSDARLIIGPWAHFPWGQSLGGVDFGPDAIGAIDALQIAWFDHHLKGAAAPDLTAGPVRLFDMGAKIWRSFAHWPARAQPASLHSTGRAALDPRAGVLVIATPGAESPAASESLVHDPWRPCPSIGGAFAMPAGPVNRTAIDARNDVLTFTSAPLEAPVTLAGDSTLAVTFDTAPASIDLSCALSVLDAEGQAMLLCEGYVHVPETAGRTARAPLRPTLCSLPAGARLRLSLALASFPNFPVNPGTGAPPLTAPLESHQVITLHLNLRGAGCQLELGVA